MRAMAASCRTCSASRRGARLRASPEATLRSMSWRNTTTRISHYTLNSLGVTKKKKTHAKRLSFLISLGLKKPGQVTIVEF